MKVCTRCKEVKEEDEFYWSSNNPSIRQARCKDCMRILSKEYRDKNKDRIKRVAQARHNSNPDIRKNRVLIKTYNISLEEYNAMVEAQEGLCAVCGRSDDRSLCVDHDHSCCPGKKSCGKCIRGLLCNDCNRALGLLGDSSDRVASALGYLTNCDIIK